MKFSFIIIPGIIKLAIGNSNSVETAIHFLYGQSPEINIDNVIEILEVAEFLMIEEMKRVCIKRMKAIKIDNNNCWKMLFLASQYNFNLENVQDFIRSHLHELLTMDEMLLVDENTVRYIISDPMLSYVSREECFLFLVKWIGHHPSRKSSFADLFSCLDPKDINAEILRNVDLGCLRDSDRFLCNNLISCHSDVLQDAIVIYPPEIQRGQISFFAYKFKSNSWCQITWLNQSGDYLHSSRKDLVQVLNYNTIVTCTGSNNEIRFYNLATKCMYKKTVAVVGQGFHCLAASKKDLYCVKDFQVATKITTKSAKYRGRPSVSLRVPGSFVFSQCKQDTEVCCLYVFESVNDTTVRLKPLLTVCGLVESLCITGGVACMLIPETKRLIIYALFECVIAFVDLKEYNIEYKSYIFPTPSGGLYVITGTDILQLDICVKTNRVSGSIVGTKTCEDRESWGCSWRHYWLCYAEDKLIPVKHLKNKNKFQYRMLPKKIGLLEEEEAFDVEFPEGVRKDYVYHFVQVKLPKEALMCPVNCLHCKHQEKPEIRTTYCKRPVVLDGYYGN